MPTQDFPRILKIIHTVDLDKAGLPALVLHETIEDQPALLRELFLAGTIRQVIIYRIDGTVIDTSLDIKVEKCNRTLHIHGGIYYCTLPNNHPRDAHLFELPDVDTRIAEGS